MLTAHISDLATVLVERRKQARFRIGMSLVIAACYMPIMGWLLALPWATAYIVLQWIELFYFHHRRPVPPLQTHADAVFALGLLASNSLVFGGFSLIEVDQLGSWGQVCSAYLLAGAILNTVLTTIDCRAAFYASLGPFAVYLAVMPVLALTSGDRPSGFIPLGISFAGVLIVLSAVRLWGAFAASKAAEKAAIARDLAERAANEERLYHQVHHDGLTGLGNRAMLQNRLAELVQNGPVGTLLMADLDGFKYINDTLGHSAGDAVLQEVAARFSQSVRPGDVVVRLGGDEFAILLPGIADPALALQIADRAISAVSDPMFALGQSVHVGASIGIAFYPSDGAGVEDLVSSADLALYKAKADGRHCSRFYQPFLRVAAQSKVSREDELLRALDCGEFQLLYRPQVRFSDGVTVGAEALLRWQHPGKGLLLPAAFLPSIENSRLAAQVGTWMLTTACRQAARWRVDAPSDFRVGVSLFEAHFRSGELVADIDRLLGSAGLPPECLSLDITGNVILRHGDAIIETLRALRSRGVGIAFDDYGTGYASLSLLKRYPLSHIKIDQSLVGAVCDSAADAAIVGGVITMAHACGLQVIADGVETQAQASTLMQQGCDGGQGSLFGKPTCASEMGGTWLRGFRAETSCLPETVRINRPALAQNAVG